MRFLSAVAKILSGIVLAFWIVTIGYIGVEAVLKLLT